MVIHDSLLNFKKMYFFWIRNGLFGFNLFFIFQKIFSAI